MENEKTPDAGENREESGIAAETAPDLLVEEKLSPVECQYCRHYKRLDFDKYICGLSQMIGLDPVVKNHVEKAWAEYAEKGVTPCGFYEPVGEDFARARAPSEHGPIYFVYLILTVIAIAAFIYFGVQQMNWISSPEMEGYEHDYHAPVIVAMVKSLTMLLEAYKQLIAIGWFLLFGAAIVLRQTKIIPVLLFAGVVFIAFFLLH